MFFIITRSAVDISMFSAARREDELLIPPGVPLVVESIANMGNGLTAVHCKEDEIAPALVVGWMRAPAAAAFRVSMSDHCFQ